MPLTKLDPDYRKRKRIKDIRGRLKNGDVTKMANNLGCTQPNISQRLRSVETLDIKFLEQLVSVTDWTDEEIARFIRGNY